MFIFFCKILQHPKINPGFDPGEDDVFPLGEVSELAKVLALLTMI